jgi:hypothetical protein
MSTLKGYLVSDIAASEERANKASSRRSRPGVFQRMRAQWALARLKQLLHSFLRRRLALACRKSTRVDRKMLRHCDSREVADRENA